MDVDLQVVLFHRRALESKRPDCGGFVPSSNFRMDVNVSGNIDAADVCVTQRQNQKTCPS
jgi:hypothetical protein